MDRLLTPIEESASRHGTIMPSVPCRPFEVPEQRFQHRFASDRRFSRSIARFLEGVRLHRDWRSFVGDRLHFQSWCRVPWRPAFRRSPVHGSIPAR